MPRLFYGNFDFEHRLADPSHQSPARLVRLNSELATAWLSIADDGDWLWTPELIDIDFFRSAEQNGLPKVTPVTSLNDVPKQVELVPWGWSPDVRQLAQKFGWYAKPPSDAAVRAANARSMSEQLERDWGVGLTGACRIESLDQLQQVIRALPTAGSRWVIKAMFGMSARERILGSGLPTAADINWIQRRLAAHKAVFFEPWVDRVEEFGIQIEIPCEGQPRFIGLTPMLVDRRGQYAGSWFQQTTGVHNNDVFFKTSIDLALIAAENLQSIGYFGPLGIDAMIYRAVDGTHHLRPLQDINARWTMGRLSLGLCRLVEKTQQGCWIHCSKDSDPVPDGLPVTRSITTTPERVGGVECHHRSQIIIG